MGKTHRRTEQPTKIDPEADRYPDLVNVLRRVIQEAEFPNEPIERLEVTCLANGDATYRVTRARAEDTEGGFLPEA